MGEPNSFQAFWDKYITGGEDVICLSNLFMHKDRTFQCKVWYMQ